MNLRLRIDLPGLAVIHYALRGPGPWLVGSADGCDIPVKVRGVSRSHLELRLDTNSDIICLDLGSTNGIFLNGERIREGVIRPGMVLQLGEAVIVLEEEATEDFAVGMIDGDVSMASSVELRVLAGDYTPEDLGRRLPFVSLVSLMGKVAAGRRDAQHWSTLNRVFSDAFSCLGSKCYKVKGDHVTLQASRGEMTESCLPLSLARCCATLPRLSNFRFRDSEGHDHTVLSLPIQMPDYRAVFLGLLAADDDPVRTKMDKLLIVPVLFQFLLQWIEELDAQAHTIEGLRKQVETLRESGSGALEGLDPILGKSTLLKSAIELADRAAPTDITVLLAGPTGSGKELFARRIHALSKRRNQPIIPVNCSSIPEHLIESELFGAEKGAYTGSDRSRKGFFEAANGGTLFLDEIADLPMSLQPKLLRVLEDGKIYPLGSTVSRSVDVRIVAASNKDLQELIRKGHFRRDLYYRLAGLVIELPPLSARNGDVPLLARAFLERANREFGRSIQGFEEEAILLMKSHAWPGNVRELLAMVRRLALTAAEPIITAEDVSAVLGENPVGQAIAGTFFDLPWQAAKTSFEKAYFTRRLSERDASIVALAKEMDISRPSLYLKLKKLGISPEDTSRKR